MVKRVLSQSRNLNRWMIQTRAAIRPRLHRLRQGINRLRQVPRWVRETVVFMCGARLITYWAIFLYRLWPSWCLDKVDPFVCPGYHNPMVRVWYIKYLCNEIELILICYAFCKICAQVSNYLFLVSVIFLGYHLIDTAMFFWNFKRYDLFYWDLMWTSLTLIWSVFKGYKPETIAKIKCLF